MNEDEAVSKARRKPDELRATGDLVGGVLAGLGLAGRLREQEALAAWPEMVGEEVARRSRALRIRDGVLFVRVDSASWSQELLFLKSQIIARFDAALGAGLVREIRFTQH